MNDLSTENAAVHVSESAPVQTASDAGMVLGSTGGRIGQVVTLGTEHFAEANAMVREALERADTVEVRDAFAQRYLGCGMSSGKTLLIHGVPGNDMACYLDGGAVEVFGNAQDQIGNTMDDGSIVVHGRCGDAAGYGMRGGTILVRDGCGWRVGIHMKQFKGKRPAIVIGGDAGSFLGEYMAGGVIVLLGKPGNYLATGMHGGVMYLRYELADADVPGGLVQKAADDADRAVIKPLLAEYNRCFADELGASVDESGKGFFCLRPATSRPYESMYAN
ncbi:glutamate synthase [Raoultibacter phocaeensis]|uniref:GltB/FmdC/FwdC-like GXGXG domain-containing protein n=1 Tax=Raoultibacter phocaeensis TaxID=2479841 RepID=UPI0021032B46|nr:glutamate synthase [Raoultibacter phocaeensis]